MSESTFGSGFAWESFASAPDDDAVSLRELIKLRSKSHRYPSDFPNKCAPTKSPYQTGLTSISVLTELAIKHPSWAA
jgi:hypothetical protein